MYNPKDHLEVEWYQFEGYDFEASSYSFPAPRDEAALERMTQDYQARRLQLEEYYQQELNNIRRNKEQNSLELHIQLVRDLQDFNSRVEHLSRRSYDRRTQC